MSDIDVDENGDCKHGQPQGIGCSICKRVGSRSPRAMGSMGKDYGLGHVSEEELSEFREWLQTEKDPTIGERPAGDYCSRVRRAVRGDEPADRDGQASVQTAVNTFVAFRAR